MASKKEIHERVIYGYEIDKSMHKVYYNIPLKHLRNMAIIMDYAMHDSYGEIAERYKMTVREVRYIIKGH